MFKILVQIKPQTFILTSRVVEVQTKEFLNMQNS